MTSSGEHGGEDSSRLELWKYACQLTLDPNTAHRGLALSEGDRIVTRGRTMREEQQHPYPEHTERFSHFPQVLCQEGLSGQCYWEVEWTGNEVFLGVTYKGIDRKDDSESCEIGMNPNSWSLIYTDVLSLACHDSRETVLNNLPSFTKRVGVYLDWPAGTLSFYGISSDTVSLLHTFHTTFTEPLYPGFWVYPGSSVSLCKRE